MSQPSRPGLPGFRRQTRTFRRILKLAAAARKRTTHAILWITLLLFLPAAVSCDRTRPAPSWARDLVIYEINPYAFTSPNGAGDGSGSGTFNSLKEKMPYLGELGVTAVWLAGFCPVTDHFFNIRSVYAVVRPDELDPGLGTGEEFRAMIREAHRHGIRVFLDVISHGVVNESPLITEHPDWFTGMQLPWRMTDYDHENEKFREWWIDVWVRYAVEYGVDGFRIDLGIQNGYETWDRIVERCALRGKEIVVFTELGRYHFGQHDRVLFRRDVAGTFAPSPQYRCHQISCHDHGYMAPPGNHYRIKGSRFLFGYDGIFGTDILLFMSGEEFNADQVSLPNLERGLFGDGGPGGWLYGSWIQWEQAEDPEKRAMLLDVKKMLKIRKDNADILHADRSSTHIVRVSHTPHIRSVPYARFLPGEKAILVAGNSSRADVTYTLEVPLEEMGLEGRTSYLVTDLWEDRSEILQEEDLRHYLLTVPADYTEGGGVRAVKIEPEDGCLRAK